jgi:hypothetical protein
MRARSLSKHSYSLAVIISPIESRRQSPYWIRVPKLPDSSAGEQIQVEDFADIDFHY